MTNGDLVKGYAGSGVALASAVVSMLPAIEAGLRIASLCVGLAVGVLTLVLMVKKIRNKKGEDET